MIDQADKLRSLVTKKQYGSDMQEAEHKLATETLSSKLNSRVITITSGKGGVGKTNLAVNLGLQLTKQGQRVVLIDADFGLANVEVLLGRTPQNTFVDVLSGAKSVQDALTEGPMGLHFISGGSGFGEMANLTPPQTAYIIDSLGFLDTIADVVLIDTGAGIGSSVINFVMAADESIIVATPEPTSINDAYAVIKTVKERKEKSGGTVPKFKIVVNRVDDEVEGKEIFERLAKVAQRFLSIDLCNLGSIPYDSQLVKAVKRQEPVAICFPTASSSRSINNICKRLLDIQHEIHEQSGIGVFMKRLVRIFEG